VKTDIARQEQAAESSSALQDAAKAAVAVVSKGSFPAAASLVKAIAAKGLYVQQATELSDAKQTGTIYLVTSETTPKKLVLALKQTTDTIQTATQRVTGSAKLATTKT
jgi:predicted regulator of amino acid metabolism with ACT domain